MQSNGTNSGLGKVAAHWLRMFGHFSTILEPVWLTFNTHDNTTSTYNASTHLIFCV